MPPPLLYDLAQVDLDRVLYDRKFIYDRLPHDYEFRQLDGLCHVDEEARTGIAFRDVRPDEWWCRGHIPGNPIFPGILQLESAAQLAAFFSRSRKGHKGFIAFGGVENCKFRDAVIPPTRIYYICKLIKDQPRRVICETQGVVNGLLVFEATITGLAMPSHEVSAS
jgi:3-hydroxyacyl-[acyl-carrier-protein] dehydratase